VNDEYNQKLFDSVKDGDDLKIVEGVGATSSLLQSLLVFKCMKDCNPSSFMQRFVAGYENSAA